MGLFTRNTNRGEHRAAKLTLLEVLPRRDECPIARFAFTTDDDDETAYRFEFSNDGVGQPHAAMVIYDQVVGGLREVVVSVPITSGEKTTVSTMAPDNGKPAASRTTSADELSQALVARRGKTLHAQDAPHHEWMLSKRPDEEELARQRAEVAGWPDADKPLISIVTPVFNTPPDFLRAMVNSALSQTYGNFELVVVDASDPGAEASAVLAGYGDPRIRTTRIVNVDIAQNTNAAIARARGDFVAFVDHDDFIEPDALYRYVCELRAHPEADLLFCDEDLYGPLTSPDGSERFYGPRFKPGWNLDLLLTHNYACHMLMVSRRALDLTERSGSDVNAAQDYDLTFKAAETARCICHVPRVLYHWREHETSTAVNRESKSYAEEAGRLAVQKHFDRIGVGVSVHPGPFPFSYRTQYHLPDPAVPISVVLACPHADAEALARTLASVRVVSEYPWDRYEVVVSAPRAFARTAKRVVKDELRRSSHGTGEVRVVPSREPDAPTLMNAGAAEARNEVVVFLDDDCEAVEGNWLTELIEPLRRPDVACTGPMLVTADGLVEAHGLIVRPDGSFGRAGRGLEITDHGYMTVFLHTRDCDVLPSRGLAVRRSDFLAASSLDVSFGPLAGADFCLRMREAGRLNVCEPYGPLRVHAPAACNASPEARARLLAVHPAIADGDSYANPNLDPESEYFALVETRR